MCFRIVRNKAADKLNRSSPHTTHSNDSVEPGTSTSGPDSTVNLATTMVSISPISQNQSMYSMGPLLSNPGGQQLQQHGEDMNNSAIDITSQSNLSTDQVADLSLSSRRKRNCKYTRQARKYSLKLKPVNSLSASTSPQTCDLQCSSVNMKNITL